MSKKTCGEYYREAFFKYGRGPLEQYAFAAGFVSGQAEKVFLGACRAAMFRPSPERYKMLLQIVEDVASRYGLLVWKSCEEIWLCRDEAAYSELRHVSNPANMNSPEWHEGRGSLCGVPKAELDFDFHERQGYRERCD